MAHHLGDALPHPIAFVFSGGANLGAVQAGMLRALRDAGIQPDLIVGSSVGALNGGLVANHGLEQGVALLERIWRNIRREDVFPGNVWSQALCLIRSRLHLFPNDKLAELICSSLTVDTFDELLLPFGAVATDLESQQGVLFNCGHLEPALLASTAIPGLFPPIEIDGKRYIDGGFTANVPLHAALMMGAASIVVLDVNSTCEPRRQPRTIVDMILTMIQSGLRRRAEIEVPMIAAFTPVIYLPAPCLEHGQVLDFEGSSALLDQAAQVASEFLASCPVPAPGLMVGALHHHTDELVCVTV
ncbi:MAG: patatin-like phospholipase family protein [Caldilineaceae bacterium]|nr:patatin-like phospholipase family protein [Caldilineaceae bacterium]